mmetsp:Transcript_10709/g.19421  ORF Transcript_10709/g.19421 Transcript_10709/m.19421 type:complete len:211 (-) Transcript_10709:1594-2226(-)
MHESKSSPLFLPSSSRLSGTPAEFLKTLHKPRRRKASSWRCMIFSGSRPGTAKRPVLALLGLLSLATRHLYDSHKGVPRLISKRIEPRDQMSKDQGWDCSCSFCVGSAAAMADAAVADRREEAFPPPASREPRLCRLATNELPPELPVPPRRFRPAAQTSRPSCGMYSGVANDKFSGQSKVNALPRSMKRSRSCPFSYLSTKILSGLISE